MSKQFQLTAKQRNVLAYLLIVILSLAISNVFLPLDDARLSQTELFLRLIFLTCLVASVLGAIARKFTFSLGSFLGGCLVFLTRHLDVLPGPLPVFGQSHCRFQVYSCALKLSVTSGGTVTWLTFGVLFIVAWAKGKPKVAVFCLFACLLLFLPALYSSLYFGSGWARYEGGPYSCWSECWSQCSPGGQASGETAVQEQAPSGPTEIY